VPLLRHGARAELRRRPRRRRPGGPRGIPTFPSGSGREGRRGREALVRGARSPPESPEAGATRAFRGCVLYEHMLSNRIDQNLQHWTLNLSNCLQRSTEIRNAQRRMWLTAYHGTTDGGQAGHNFPTYETVYIIIELSKTG
jgi:hypothetical protein